jgi:L-seryl-tRNA(Ser) seleniumtransferase
VGTTNRTRIDDYEAAVGPETALLLQVHTSNFKLVGFTESPPTHELVALGRRTGTPVVADLGSGYLRRFPALPFPDEPTVQEAVAAGLDVITFSGDKMLGGPQCGILVGRQEWILRLRREPLFRAVRPDKLTLAALEATLLEWRAAGDEPPRAIPFYRALLEDPETRERRARSIAAQAATLPLGVSVRPSAGQVGSGSVPGQGLPSIAVTLEGPGGQADLLAASLRAGDPPVFSRVQDGKVWLDLLSVPPEEDEIIVRALARIAAHPQESTEWRCSERSGSD